MSEQSKTNPCALNANDVSPRPKSSSYPEPFARRIAGRSKRALGEVFGLKNIGVNLTTLAPGAQSALLHRHTKSEEFVYILAGHPTLVSEHGETELEQGMVAGFVPGGNAHHLINRTDQDVTYLEIGDRPPDDTGVYPDDDLVAEKAPDGCWTFKHKDGRLY